VHRFEKKKESEREKKLEAITQRMKRIEEMKLQKIKIAEEKRKLQVEMRHKKEEMMAKFEKLMKKGKNVSKDEFYKQIFNNTDNFSPFGSKTLSGKADQDMSINNIVEKDEEEPKVTAEKNKSPVNEHDESFIKDTQSNKPKKVEMSITQAVEEAEEIPAKEEEKVPSVIYLTVEEIKEKVDEKKRELEHNLLDVLTKLEIEEKKLLEDISEEDSEEEKTRKNELYNDEKNKNEQKIAQLRE